MNLKISILIFLFCLSFGKAQNNVKNGETFINALMQNQTETCTSLIDESVKAQISPAVLEQVSQQIQMMNGNFKNITAFKEAEEMGYKIVYYNIQFENKVNGLKVVFSDAGKIAGFFMAQFPGTEQKRPQTPKPPFPYSTEDVSFKNPKDKNTLAGTISLSGNTKIPVAVLITGSGAQNRNEELFGHQPFAVIADDFARKGIATLRLDDRGIGESSAGTSDDTTLSFAGDINAAVEFLYKKGYRNIGLIGHSEGGLIAPIVASQNKKIKFVVSLAGPGMPIADLMYKQNEDILKLSGVSGEVLAKELQTKKKLFNFIADYKGTRLKSDLNNYLTKNFPQFSEAERKAYEQLSKPWWQFFLQTKPAVYWSKLKIPVLALNGSLDTQVAADENLNAIKKANPKAEIMKLEYLNHLFQTAKTGSPQEYQEIEETFSPKALDIMSDWILKLKF